MCFLPGLFDSRLYLLHRQDAFHVAMGNVVAHRQIAWIQDRHLMAAFQTFLDNADGGVFGWSDGVPVFEDKTDVHSDVLRIRGDV